MARASLGPGLDGILVVAKPQGPTSHDVVALVRRLAATRRVGHGGTLDPFASGVLPIFLGHGTRVVEYHAGDQKGYRATVCFGASSTTDDLEGDLTPSDGPAPSLAGVEAALDGFRGPIAQRPPIYSAVKVAGRRAYAMARAGEAVELAERQVTIHELTIASWDASDPDRPIAILDVVCSAGTYIRALARDLGERLRSAAYLGALTRTASGPFRLDAAVTLDAIRDAAAGAPAGLVPLLLPIDSGLEAFPEITLNAAETESIARGQFVSPTGGIDEPGDRYRLRTPDGALAAIATRAGGRLAPDKVFIAPTVTPATSAAAGATTPCLSTMHVVTGVDRIAAEQGPLFVVVGVFDGLHLGHAYLLRQLVMEAERRHANPTVITFDHHPDEVLTGHAPPLLLDPEERLERLAASGVAVTVVQHFDDDLRRTTFESFVGRIRDRVALAGFLMTPDAAFGYERRGTPAALTELGARDGFDVVVVPPFDLDGRAVRSTEIRERIAAGRLDDAATMLGRPFTVTGIAGEGRLVVALPMAMPPDGSYPARIGSVESMVTIVGGTLEVPGIEDGRRVVVEFAPL